VHPVAVAARIIAAMRRPFDVEGKEVFIGATVGIAHARDASLGDALKIDKSFIDTVARSSADRALARTIVELGHGMRLETIAEGIETVEQLERLRVLDCELGQGYHFSVPLDGAELTAYLEQALEHERRAA
jgi:predicted signal transduction protein with EAL and GGDEF domain